MFLLSRMRFPLLLASKNNISKDCIMYNRKSKPQNFIFSLFQNSFGTEPNFNSPKASHSDGRSTRTERAACSCSSRHFRHQPQSSMPDQLSRGTPARVFQSSLSICRSRSTTTPSLRVQLRFYSAQTLTSPTRSSPLANLLASTLSKVSTGIPSERPFPKNSNTNPILHLKFYIQNFFSPFFVFN